MAVPRALRALGRSEVLGVLFGFLVLHVVFAPGLLTADSAWMLEQADSGQINDWLSPLPTWLLHIFDISGSEWFTVTTIAFLVTASRLLARAYSRPVAGALAGAIACSPPVVGWLSVLSRDVWCGVALLAASLFASERSSTTRRNAARWTALIATLSFAMWTRQNAVLPVLGIATLAAFADSPPAPRGRRLLIAGAVGISATAVMALGQSLIVERLIDPLHTHPEQATYVSDLAAMSFSTRQQLVPAEVWNGSADYDRLSSVWNDADGVAIYNVVDPPIHTVYADAAVHGVQRKWLRAIREEPLAYLLRRARLLEIQLFEIQLTDPYVPGMAGTVAGHVLARPHLVSGASAMQRYFWLLSGLRVWHVLAAGLISLRYLRTSKHWHLALCLQAASCLTVVSLIPTAPVAAYRFTWVSVSAGLLTIALAIAHRLHQRGRRSTAGAFTASA